MADPTPIILTTAVENMITAYNDAAGRSLPDFLELGTGNLGGKTLLNMGAGVKVILEGGVRAKNICWQVAGEASQFGYLFILVFSQ